MYYSVELFIYEKQDGGPRLGNFLYTTNSHQS